MTKPTDDPKEKKRSSVSLIDYLDRKVRSTLIQRFIWLYIIVMLIPYTLMLYRNLIVDFHLLAPVTFTLTYVIVLLVALRVIPVSLKGLVRLVALSTWIVGIVIAIRNQNLALAQVFAILGALLFSMTLSKRKATLLVTLIPQTVVLLELLYFELQLATFVIAAAVSFTGLVVAYLIGAVVDLLRSNSDALEASLAQQDQLNIKLEAMLQQQKNMFAVIGHELRTPLASVDMVTRDKRMPDGEKLALIADISANLLTVLEDLRGVLAPEKSIARDEVVENPKAVVLHALNALSFLLERHQKQLHTLLPEDGTLCCRFRAQALRQLVTNLIKNAALHSGGANIWLSLSYSDSNSDSQDVMAVLKVEDDGKGIPEDQVAVLFEAFARGDTDQDGTGLGLFIAQQLAEELDGKLSYENSRFGGACFSLTFRMKVTACEVPHESSPDLLQGLRILFAEDNPMLQSLTASVLTDAGAEVVCCDDGKEALERYQEHAYDLILTDLMMPRISGTELAETLRASGCTLPIVGVSATIAGQEIEQFIASGGNALIPKPINLEALLAVLVGEGDTRHSSSATREQVLSSPPDVSDPTELPLTDFERALDRMGNEPDVFRDVFNSWEEGMQECLHAIEVLLSSDPKQDETRQSLRLQIHSIKGMASVVGACQLQHFAGTLEAQLAGGMPDWQMLGSDLEKIRQLYSSSHQEITRHLKQS